MPKQDYTLISFIGAHYGEGYDTTEYTFFPGKENEERIVSNDTSLAIISAKKQHWRIVRAIIIGTYTSKWSELVSSADSDLKSRIDSVPMNDENDDLRKELETYLSKKYKTEFRLIAHTDHIDDDSIEGLSLFYNSDVFSELKNDTGYLVDITHSFRTMPILLFQTLQQHMPAFNENKSIELIYGEQGIDKKHSVFRDLGKFWDAYKLTAALNLFRYSFDGRGLVPYLEQVGYKKAAEWVSFFSSAVKSDYLMPVWKSLKLLNEAIKELSADPGLAWVIETRSILQEIAGDLNRCTEPYDIFYRLGTLLRQRGLYTQAVIAYEAAVETRMAVYKARKEGAKQYRYIGKYSLWLDSKESSGLRNLLKKRFLPRNLEKQFDEFVHLRNNIAHAGASVWKKDPSYTGQLLSELKGKIGSYSSMVGQILKLVDSEEKNQIRRKK